MASMTPILEAIDEPALIIEKRQVRAANRAARDLLGQRIVGEDIRLVIRHPKVLDMVAAARRGEVNVEGVGRTERPWRVIGVPLDDGEMLIRLVDRAAARAAEKMRVDFVANASHELRTPIATILGYAETLADEDAPDEETRRRFASTIQSEAKRMLQIVEDLMGLSRIEADRFVQPRSRIDLSALIARVIEQNAPLAQRRECEIVSRLADDLPEILGDGPQLSQLADNLIANAIRYGSGPEDCRIEIATALVRGRVRLTVRDHGPGIEPQHLPRLTERFYRVDAARSREGGGTGLGLAIVKHIAERHRASLDIASAPGAGTRVTVDFPLPDRDRAASGEPLSSN
ncbi:ATP-binding protein [Sphingomicrobium lutaoense]|uniref:histidine kinase n=1 Tax=Sphingomicrobium lutaoense TaxID=515949 RepID=A0A839YZ70_9SPHN|nr:ATP-binding protein [Sphingomicrobium lutaoense]MBB3764429.1 two-component system phosphate regulon sensor histidine kinase PhoR [Sphingomicrobium lutaoense]